jgi:hypothetical protein
MDSYVVLISLAIGIGGAIWFYTSRSSAGHKTNTSSAFLANKGTTNKIVPVKGPVKKVAEKKAVSLRLNIPRITKIIFEIELEFILIILERWTSFENIFWFTNRNRRGLFSQVGLTWPSLWLRS